MKPQTEIKKLRPTLALIAIFSLCAAASAQAGPEPHLRSGMFGCATGQVARINAVNIGNPDTRPIQFEMMFLDGTGAVVGRDMQTIAFYRQSRRIASHRCSARLTNLSALPFG
jgi:hypothetical protein